MLSEEKSEKERCKSQDDSATALERAKSMLSHFFVGPQRDRNRCGTVVYAGVTLRMLGVARRRMCSRTFCPSGELPKNNKQASDQTHLPAFKGKQFLLDREAAAIASKIAIGANHAVAGNNDRNRIGTVGKPDGARRIRLTDLTG